MTVTAELEVTDQQIADLEEKPYPDHQPDGFEAGTPEPEVNLLPSREPRIRVQIYDNAGTHSHIR